MKDKIENFLKDSDRVLVAMWKVKDGKLIFERHTINFPIEDFPQVIENLTNDLEQEKDKVKP